MYAMTTKSYQVATAYGAPTAIAYTGGLFIGPVRHGVKCVDITIKKRRKVSV